MSLILVNDNEIMVGKPAPWSLYDQGRNIILNQGEVVRDVAHREALLAMGACHEMSWDTQGGNVTGSEMSFETNEAVPEQAEAVDSGARFTFDDMKLKIEDKLQLQPPAQLSQERFSVRVIGFLRGGSLLVTMPITSSGLRLQLREKEKVVMRSFSGQNAFGFACTIMRLIKIPYEYMHLSFPEDIQGILIRKAPRVKTRIIAAVKDSTTGTEKQISALISDISANGVSLESKQPLGDKGAILNLSFRVQLHNIEAFLSLKGIIRAVISVEQTDKTSTPFIRYGIEFQEMQPNDSVILQSLIYQQMIENPHKLM